MKFGFKSYNSWDPLKKVLIGSTLPKDFFADFPDFSYFSDFHIFRFPKIQK